MDDLVKAAMLKWPNVPACYGWLGLDARGQWWMRDDRAQQYGDFCSGLPGAKGSMLRHDKLIEFICRNFQPETDGELAGAWFFQNGPQKVYVELEETPLILRVSEHSKQPELISHIGQSVSFKQAYLSETGRLYVQTDQGLGLIHSQDMLAASGFIESGQWVPDPVQSSLLERTFNFMRSPKLARHAIVCTSHD